MYWRWIFYWAVSRETKYAVYTLYLPYVSSAVFTTLGEPVEAGLRKEMNNKNGAVITKKYTARDDVKLNMQGDLNINIFGLYEWVFVRMILKLIAFLTKLIV